jgi:hypothetical protein
MAKYEDSPEDKREDARGQKRFDAKKGGKKHRPRKPKAPPIALSTPPGGGNEGFDDDMGGMGGMSGGPGSGFGM